MYLNSITRSRFLLAIRQIIAFGFSQYHKHGKENLQIVHIVNKTDSTYYKYNNEYKLTQFLTEIPGSDATLRFPQGND